MACGKIFCVGFPKTGTTSMAVALRRLGFNVGNPVKRVTRKVNWSSPEPRSAIWVELQRVADEFDALQDSPCQFFFKDLDEHYPDSKFILTERDPMTWIRSYKNFFTEENNELRRWMYGEESVTGNERHYVELYTKQMDAIKRYFKSRDEEFLVMNLEKGDGWLKLVQFLATDLVGRFPHRAPQRGGKILNKLGAVTSTDRPGRVGSR